MGYTRLWEPEVAPERDDLAVWKIICSDIENSLLLAGLEKTNDSGQLVINSVPSLPSDGDFAGFHIFKFTDPMQESFPIFIKIEYGCTRYGLSSSSNSGCGRMVAFSWQVGTAVDGAGELTGSVSHKYITPQSYTGSSNLTSPTVRRGTSYICYNSDSGFLGFCYGVGSLESPGSSSGRYIGATFTLFIQRRQGIDGSPSPSGGVILYGPDLSTTWAAGNAWELNNLQAASSQYLDSHNVIPPMNSINRRPDADTGLTPSGAPLVYPINALGYDQMHSMGCLVQGWVENLGQGFQFSVTLNGVERNYISLGNRTCMSMDDIRAQRSALAMLWE